jgi:hypothetical protein
MKNYLGNRLIQIGLVLILVGWRRCGASCCSRQWAHGPTRIPIPLGRACCSSFTAWPAIICLGMGVLQVRRN